MAEYALSCVIRSLDELLSHEAKHVPELQIKVGAIQDKLRQLKGTLQIADARQEVDEGIRSWVAETREAAYNFEDLLLSAVSVKKEGGILKTLSQKFKEGANLHCLEQKINEIDDKMSALESDYRVRNLKSRQRGSLNPVPQRSLQQRTYSHLAEEEFVGLDEDVQELVARLVDKDRDQIYRVVSITGMGGIGKTTLAKKIYHYEDVRSHFHAFAWACISQQWQHEDVLKRILNKLEPEKKKEINEMSCERLVDELIQVQRRKRCLIVLDDVWDTDVLDLLTPVFRQVNIKTLITTRNKDFTGYVDVDVPCYLYQQRHLHEKESWELLKKKVGHGLNIAGISLDKFQGSDRSVEENGSTSSFEDDDTVSNVGSFYSCNSEEEDEEEIIIPDTPRSEDYIQDQRNQMEIERLGREMVARCGGLPLAIVVLGGLLMTKATVNEWRTVHQNLNSYLTRGRSFRGNGTVKEVLALSYHDLPYQLKPCFLYLGHFPEDFKIPTRKLYQLWSAEGFTSQEGYQAEENKTVMDVSERYLGELVQRCMVQVRVDEATGRFKSCWLHDLTRELCLVKGKEENFLKKVPPRYEPEIVVSPSRTAVATSAGVARRLSVTVDSDFDSYYPPRQENNEHVRSALFFSRLSYRRKLQAALDFVCDEYKVLRVLDLERFDFEEKLSGKIGDLVYLRYLSLRGSQFNRLPSSIRNLIHLETLDLRVPFRVVLIIPNDIIGKLYNLKHLYLPPRCEGRLKIGTLSHLETLKNFDTRVSDYGDVSKLPKLQKLAAVLELKLEHFRTFISSLKLKNRRIRDSSLIIRYDFQLERELSVLRELVGFTHLRKLDLVGLINSLPDYGAFSKSLNKLTLRKSQLKEDPMTTLEKLPNLYSLILRKDVFEVNEICCSPQGFPQLRILELHGLTRLERWTIEEGAMPNLFCIKIDECKNLEMLPEGIKFIATLKELVIANMPDDFKRRIQKVQGGGEDCHKVEDVASITIMDTDSSSYGTQLRQQSSGNSYSGLFQSFSPSLVPKGWQDS